MSSHRRHSRLIGRVEIRATELARGVSERTATAITLVAKEVPPDEAAVKIATELFPVLDDIAHAIISRLEEFGAGGLIRQSEEGLQVPHSVFAPVQIVLIWEFEHAVPAIGQQYGGAMNSFRRFECLHQQLVEHLHILHGIPTARSLVTSRVSLLIQKSHDRRRVVIIPSGIPANSHLDQVATVLPNNPGIKLSSQVSPRSRMLQNKSGANLKARKFARLQATLEEIARDFHSRRSITSGACLLDKFPPFHMNGWV